MNFYALVQVLETSNAGNKEKAQWICISNIVALQVVQAVGGKLPVFLDGGVRRGTDVFKALALGAQAVLVRLSNFESKC